MVERQFRIRFSQYILLICSILLLSMGPRWVQADDYSDYVREVLEEDAQANDSYYSENAYYHEDSYYEQQQREQEEAFRRRQAEEQRLAQEQADRQAAQREKAFQDELDRMNKQQQKAARKQKQKDAKMVRSILKAAESNDLYRILGIRNWKLRIPERSISIAGGKVAFTIPGVTLKETTSKDIRKAYRSRAMATHPDKNRDGRAQEAFVVVEEAASILSDANLRELYDLERQLHRQAQQQAVMETVTTVVSSTQSTVWGVLKTIHSVLGPFATPVLILGALII